MPRGEGVGEGQARVIGWESEQHAPRGEGVPEVTDTAGAEPALHTQGDQAVEQHAACWLLTLNVYFYLKRPYQGPNVPGIVGKMNEK